MQDSAWRFNKYAERAREAGQLRPENAPPDPAG